MDTNKTPTPITDSKKDAALEAIVETSNKIREKVHKTMESLERSCKKIWDQLSDTFAKKPTSDEKEI